MANEERPSPPKDLSEIDKLHNTVTNRTVFYAGLIFAIKEEIERLETEDPDESEAKFRTWRKSRERQIGELRRKIEKVTDHGQGMEEALAIINRPNDVSQFDYEPRYAGRSIPNWLEKDIEKYGSRAIQIVRERTSIPLNPRE